MFLLNWWRKFHYERLSELNIGDKVEFKVRVEINMGPELGAWVGDPWGSQVMKGEFGRPGEKYIIRGTVSGLSDFNVIHVKYPSYLPGYKSDNIWAGNVNSFCCGRIWLKRVGYEDNHS